MKSWSPQLPSIQNIQKCTILGLQSNSTSHTVCHSHLITHNSTAIWPHSHSCRIQLSILYESLIRLRSHTVRIFTGVTTAFWNRTHTRTFSGLTTAFSLCERNRAGQLIVCHVIKSERASLLHKCASTVWCMFSCVFLVTYGDREMSCVSSESFRSSVFQRSRSLKFCILRTIQMLSTQI